eukprot:gene7471-8300_t
MNPPMYGDSYFKLYLAMQDGNIIENSTSTASKETAGINWDVYQYVMCSLFILDGCLVLCPLLQKRNYKSKQRKRILLIDGMLLLLCLSRVVTLLFSYNQSSIATGSLIFLWAFGSSLMAVSLTVFLFILRSTTRLEAITWKFKYTVVLVLEMATNMLDMVIKDVIVFRANSAATRAWMVNFLLILSLVNCFTYFVLGMYFCGTYRRMNQNRKPSIRLIKETSTSSSSGSRTSSKIVHADARNFRSMVLKLRLLALLMFLEFAINFYMNVKILIVFNSAYEENDSLHIPNWEVWGMEVSTRTIELIMIVTVFCVGFFSSQHKEAAKQWIRGLSLTRSNDELSARRTTSLDSAKDTLGEERNRACTLTVDVALSDYSNETLPSSLDEVIPLQQPAQKSKNVYVYPDTLEAGTLIKQNANYLMVPNSVPFVIDASGEVKDTSKSTKKKLVLEVVDEIIESR